MKDDHAINENGALLLRVADAAKQAGVRPETIWRWIRQGRIPDSAVVRFGPRSVRLNTSRFAAVLKEREAENRTHRKHLTTG